jgi:Putative peptidoglycan binding domain
MNTKVTAIIVALALASAPAAAQTRPVKGHKQSGQAAAHAAGSASEKPGGKASAAIANAYAALPAAERLAIQADLAWIGAYEGLPSGDIDDRTIEAVKLYQKGHAAKDTGILDDEQRTRLASAAAGPQQAVGWRVIDDRTGARFGLPEKLVSPAGASLTGSRFSSGRGQIVIETFRLSEASLPALFEEEKKTPKTRHAEASALKPDSFVIAGTQGLKNVVVRADQNGSEIRGITVLYDQANKGMMMPAAIAIADSFQGFPDPNAGPPPGQRAAVAYGTAIVADRGGALIAPLPLASGCESITVPGFGHAVQIAQDGTNDLALLRLYGAQNLVPAPLAGEVAQADALTLIGIAAPPAQHGGNGVTHVVARRDGEGVEPAPAPGFSGAAAVDAQGRFAGVVELKSQVVAGAAASGRQAVLTPAAAVRAFLTAHGVAPIAAPGTMDQSVVRVICVRK